MRRPTLVLILCLLAGFLAWWELRIPHLLESDVQMPSENVVSRAEATATDPKPIPMSASQPASVQTPARDDQPTDPNLKRAYKLSLDQGNLTCLEAEDIQGDFAKQRRKPEEWSGMLRCRLMSEKNVILAEELLPAPDHLCAVIDPRSGSDKPVPYTVAGPVVFQVRLPRVQGAVRLDVFRIIQPADTTKPGLEGQLGSIPLPRS